MNYMHGRMYIGKVNTRVENHNLKGSENEQIVWDLMSSISRRTH